MSQNSMPQSPIEGEVHRKLAIYLFNDTWRLMEKTDRSKLEDDIMIHQAHASRYHWGVAGEPVHFGRGEWQISRVYALLRRGEPALYHANRYMDWVTEHELSPFDKAYAFEALGRAYWVLGEPDKANQNKENARQAGELITTEESRKLLSDDLATIEV